MFLQRVQSHSRLFYVAVANQLESLHGKLLAICVLAPWKESICNLLIPLPTAASFAKNKPLILHFRLNETQGIDEVNFTWSLRADLGVDMYLNER
jgi:hypothetical protein